MNELRWLVDVFYPLRLVQDGHFEQLEALLKSREVLDLGEIKLEQCIVVNDNQAKYEYSCKDYKTADQLMDLLRQRLSEMRLQPTDLLKPYTWGVQVVARRREGVFGM